MIPNLKSPVTLIIYNRLDYARLVFETIRKIKPSTLFVIADGPKDNQDKTKINQTREIIKNIDWECELRTNFSDINLGCSDRIISGLNWVFKYVDRTIIIEDDCLPHPSFFQFCEEMLAKYKDDEQVMHISGFNVMGNSLMNESYFFSKYILPPWGWATWKRAWKFQNPQLDTWQQIKTWAYQNISQEYFTDWTDLFEGARVDRKTWDTSWNVDIWKQKSLGIIPKHSLVQNIGFGKDATFTKNNKTNLSLIESKKMIFPLIHPINKKVFYDSVIEKGIVEAVRANRN